MKALRRLLATVLILVIIGGLGYIAYNVFYLQGMNHQGMNTTPDNSVPPNNSIAPNPNQQPGGHYGASPGTQNPPSLNTTAIQNRDRLTQAVNTINQAIDLITIDPYSKATMPGVSPNNIQDGTQGQGNQSTDTVNIYPNGNTSVNITPSGNNPPNNTVSPANTNQGTASVKINQNYVYDQGKLQQLHNGIFTLAQGIMTINQLNDELLAQASFFEANPVNYQTFVVRYNIALQNKTKLNNAISLLGEASTLINVNPYGSPNGYAYNADAMQQLHQGVFKLAQGMTMLNRLNEDFTIQMAEASAQVQKIVNASYQDPTVNHGTVFDSNLFGNMSMTTVFNLILIVMLVGLIAGVLGAISSVFKRNGQTLNDRSNLDNDPNII